MRINPEKADRLKAIAKEMRELLDEFKHICRNSMTPSEYDQFKYRCLGHLEPGLVEEHDWVTGYSSIDSLEKVAERSMDDATEICDNCGGDCPAEDLDENSECPDCQRQNDACGLSRGFE